MPLRRALSPGEYYHVFNRAAFKSPIFKDRDDYARFLFCIVFFQSPTPFPKVGRLARTFGDTGFNVSERDFLHVLAGRSVELVAFCIMGNHFHLLVRELQEGGIGRYMQRLGDAYTKYVHAKYHRSGHVFEGRYKAIHVRDNRQLLYLSAYIHRNPHELKAWHNKEDRYPWSSLTDYVRENRWGGLLAQEIILDQFEGSSRSNYADFVRTSTAKILADELELD